MRARRSRAASRGSPDEPLRADDSHFRSVHGAFLGTDRMAPPIAEHHPDLVLHGHGHAGTFEGLVGPVPVYNVAVPVMGRDFWIFELDGSAPERKLRRVSEQGDQPAERPPGDVRA